MNFCDFNFIGKFRKQDEFLLDNRHILYHMIDTRQNHIEEFNMFLLLLIVRKYISISVSIQLILD